jgi:methyl-accepting chemotaxis protein
MLYFLDATTNAADETSRITSLLKPAELAKQIVSDTKEIFTSIPETLVSIDQQFASVMKTMGVGAGLSNTIKDNLSKGAFAILELGGDIKDATSLQNEVVEQLNKNIVQYPLYLHNRQRF